MKQTLLSLALAITAFACFGQGNLGIGTSSPHSRAISEISAIDKDLLIPQRTKIQRAAIMSPATGLLIYHINSAANFYYNAGTANTVNRQALSGNADIMDGFHFSGTPDSGPLTFKVNNQRAGRIETEITKNTSFGYVALQSNTIGNYDTPIGYLALEANRTTIDKGVIRVGGLGGNTTGSNSTAIGPATLLSKTTGNGNIAIGNVALYSNTLSLWCHIQLLVQDTTTPLKSKVYVVHINKGTNNSSFGYLQAIYDSAINISSTPVHYGVSAGGKLLPYSAINTVSLHRKGAMGRGILFGTLRGIVLGGIIGAISYSPCTNCFIDFGKGFYILAGSILGTIPGVIVGASVGSNNYKYSVDRSKEGFDEMHSQLQKVYGAHNSNTQ